MKVTMYRSEDGQLFDTEAACAKHERDLQIHKNADRACYDTGVWSEDDRGNKVLYEMDLAAFVVANADVLRGVLGMDKEAS